MICGEPRKRQHDEESFFNMPLEYVPSGSFIAQHVHFFQSGFLFSRLGMAGVGEQLYHFGARQELGEQGLGFCKCYEFAIGYRVFVLCSFRMLLCRLRCDYAGNSFQNVLLPEPLAPFIQYTGVEKYIGRVKHRYIAIILAEVQ